MKCTYTSKNGQMSFEFEAADAKDIFAQRSMVELHDEEVCGLCKCPHIRCEVRKSGEYTYYEMRCQKCGARLEFGQNKDMKNLFVKRSEHLETNGWYIYQGNDRDHDEAPQHAQNGRPNGSGPKTPNPTSNGSNTSAKPKSPPTDKDDPHKTTIEALRVTQDKKNADEWLAYGASKLRTAAQRAEQEKAHKAALDRIRLNPPPSKLPF
jgi:hypothetical protein